MSSGRPLNREARRRHVAVLATAAVVFGLAPPAALADSGFEGESLSLSHRAAGRVVSDASAGGGKALKILSNSYGSKTIRVATASRRLVIRARGDRCSGAPKVTVEVDGTSRLVTSVRARSWTQYATKMSLKRGRHTIRLRYTNDYMRSRCDRNLFVDSVKLESVRGSRHTDSRVLNPAPASLPAHRPAPAPSPAPGPAPVAAPTATPIPISGQHVASGRLVREAAFETGDMSEVNLQQGAPGRIVATRSPAVQGDFSARFQVRDGDRWAGDVGKNRSEALIEASRGYAPREGDDYWHRYWFMIPESTALPTRAGDTMHLTQTNSNDNREHLAGLTFRVGELTFDNDSGPVWELPAEDFERGRWYKVLWHSHWSKDSSKGYDELWIDDVKVGVRSAKTLSSTGNYMKFGLYRMDHGQGTAEVYFDGLRIATTRAMAEAR